MNQIEKVQLSTEEMLHRLQFIHIELEKKYSELSKRYAELESSNMHFKGFYDMSRVGFLTLDRYGLIQEANHSSSLLLGVERDELLQTELTQYLATGFKEVWIRQLPDLVSEHSKSKLDLRLTHHNGETFNAQLDCLNIRGPHGESFLHIAFSANNHTESLTDSLIKWTSPALVDIR